MTILVNVICRGDNGSAGRFDEGMLRPSFTALPLPSWLKIISSVHVVILSYAQAPIHVLTLDLPSVDWKEESRGPEYPVRTVSCP